MVFKFPDIMNHYNKTTQLVAYLFGLLFMLIAEIQFMHMDKFEAQLAEFPILSSFSLALSWLIPIIEIAIAVLLFRRKTKLLGLYITSFWFVFFSFYIMFLLNASTYIPCACGHSFLTMSWVNQLLFNTVCILISAAALAFNKPNTYALSCQTRFTTHYHN
ncbi:hypothetical protein FBD94_08280 [Pedobacter hiemivivus]|uniref:Methylamine utilisation protein MauE domain-containing protein n=1 Tax=Pedobacter hiemivivus TaxID=2530454 RepID=A0A4U1GGH6_9SPHI|nr:hypothetical protein FBD94_08280 [Pedobacter hiemivivus]